MSLVQEIYEHIDPEELDQLRAQYDIEKPHPSDDSSFAFAWGCVRSSRDSDVQLGVEMLKKLLMRSPTMAREVHYYLSVGYFRLGEYSEARRHAECIVAMEPKNQQAHAMISEIEAKMRREGLIGVAIVGGAVAGLGLLLGLMRKRK